MPMNENQKKKFVAVIRQLKKQKGVSIKQSEITSEINNIKKAQNNILKIKDQHKDEAVVQAEADKEYKKLQNIVNNLNDYMKILHPEGLIDFGTGTNGQQVVGQG